MERKAHYALIGLFTFAVVAGAFGFIFWLHHSSGKKQAVAYRIIFDSSVSGLQVGGNVLFNGIRVGEVTNLRLDPDKPSQVIALLAVNKATPIRSDTRVGLEFQGLTGVAAVSLKGVSATTPLIEREEGEPPTLKADPSASQDMMQAARDVLNKAEEVITANQEAVHQAIKDIATFSASLARNSDNVDSIMNNTNAAMANAKEATASARTLIENLDKRTDEITIGVNRMTATATRQIEIAGKAIVELTHNPQRILFGGGGGVLPLRGDDSAGTPAAVKRIGRRAHVVRIERQFDRLSALGREVKRLGQHQVAMRFFHGRGRGRQAERHAVEPAVGLQRHRPAQFAERHVARRIAAQEIDQPRRVGVVAFGGALRHRQHDVAVRVVDGERAGGADDADVERIDRRWPGDRQRP